MSQTKGTSAPKRELRTFTANRPLTVRTAANGAQQIQGYAIVWHSPSVDLGGFTEICDPGMLTRSLRDSPDVLMLRDHKQELLLGRTTAGTLDLKVDSVGLAFTVTLPNTEIGADTAENVRLGNLTGCSFAFNCVEDSWNEDANGVTRTLLVINLFECSITSFPAYRDTVASLRSCPASLRTKLRKKKDDLDAIIDDDVDDSDDDEDEDDDEERCQCDCDECADGNCEACLDEDCDDGDCLGCPSQDDSRADKMRVRSVFQRLMT